MRPSLFHCGKPLQLKTGKDIYPHIPRLATRYYYQCSVCGAYVGCHPNTKDILGTPAGPALRKLRQKVHAVFDQHHECGAMTRSEAYAALARQMNRDEVHIAWFDEADCHRALELLRWWSVMEAA